MLNSQDFSKNETLKWNGNVEKSPPVRSYRGGSIFLKNNLKLIVTSFLYLAPKAWTCNFNCGNFLQWENKLARHILNESPIFFKYAMKLPAPNQKC
jgi:hypothetical protein